MPSTKSLRPSWHARCSGRLPSLNGCCSTLGSWRTMAMTAGTSREAMSSESRAGGGSSSLASLFASPRRAASGGSDMAVRAAIVFRQPPQLRQQHVREAGSARERGQARGVAAESRARPAPALHKCVRASARNVVVRLQARASRCQGSSRDWRPFVSSNHMRQRHPPTSAQRAADTALRGGGGSGGCAAARKGPAALSIVLPCSGSKRAMRAAC